MEQNIEQLGKDIRRSRDGGTVEFVFLERQQFAGRRPAQLLDAFVLTLGFSQLGSGWHEVDQIVASAILQSVLRRDLAYDSKIMSGGRAQSLVSRFLDLFTPSVRYFTNGTFEGEENIRRGGRIRLRSWAPLTKATFDTGIACLDDQHIGILWVQDED